MLKKGGAVAIKSAVSESMPCRMGGLSLWKSVRLAKLGDGMSVFPLGLGGGQRFKDARRVNSGRFG